jgi:type II secretory pathway pseudopilin PulG
MKMFRLPRVFTRQFAYGSLAKASRGVTLLEISLAIVVFSLLGLGISHLFLSSTEARLLQEVHLAEQALLTSLVQDLRQDLSQQSALSVDVGTKTISITRNDGLTVGYVFDGTTANRTIDGTTYDYRAVLADNVRNNFRITLDSMQNLASSGRIILRDLRASELTSSSNRFDTAFNKNHDYVIMEVTLNTMQGYEFD